MLGLDTLVKVADQPDDHTDAEAMEAWLEARRSGMTGTDIAAVFGEHERVKPIDVFHDKRPDIAPPLALEALRARQRADHERSKVGRLLEPVVIGWFADGEPHWPRSGGRLAALKPPTMRRTDRPWQVISPDSLLYEPERIEVLGVVADPLEVLRPDDGMEVKTHGMMAGRDLPVLHGDADEDAEVDLPARLRFQSLWYASGVDLPRWHAAALVDTHLRKTWVIHAEPELVAAILEEAERWHLRHVVKGIEPEPDGSESFRRHLNAKWRDVVEVILPRRGAVDELAKQRKALTLEAKRIELATDKIDQEIQRVIGAHQGIETVVGTVTWKFNERGAPQYKGVAQELAERLGLTDNEYQAVVDKHRGTAPRVCRFPQWTRGVK